MHFHSPLVDIYLFQEILYVFSKNKEKMELLKRSELAELNSIKDMYNESRAKLESIFNPQYKVNNTKFESALKLAEIAKNDLEKAEKEHDKHFLLQLEEQNELFKVINQMALLNMTTLKTEEIIRLLLEATEQVYEIRKQWERMIEFFSKLAAQAYSTQQVR